MSLDSRIWRCRLEDVGVIGKLEVTWGSRTLLRRWLRIPLRQSFWIAKKTDSTHCDPSAD